MRLSSSGHGTINRNGAITTGYETSICFKTAGIAITPNAAISASFFIQNILQVKKKLYRVANV